MEVSINRLSELTGFARKTVVLRIDGLPNKKKGPALMYDSRRALSVLYHGASEEDGGGKVDAAEASRQLTIARRQQIDLEMEVTRKERIPLDVIEAKNETVFSNVAGLLKAHLDKPLTAALTADIFTELRNIQLATHG